MNDRSLITTGAIGAALAAICCATPLLAVMLGGIGLSAWLPKADYIVMPVLLVGSPWWALGFTSDTSQRHAAIRGSRKGIAHERRQSLRSHRHRQRHGRAGGELPCAGGGMVGCGHRPPAFRGNLCSARLRSKKDADQRRRGDRHGPAHEQSIITCPKCSVAKLET